MLTEWEKSRIVGYLEIAREASVAMQHSEFHGRDVKDVAIARGSELAGLIDAILNRG